MSEERKRNVSKAMAFIRILGHVNMSVHGLCWSLRVAITLAFVSVVGERPAGSAEPPKVPIIKASKEIEAHWKRVLSLSISFDGKYLVSTGWDDCEIEIRDLGAGDGARWRLPLRASGAFFLPNSRRIAFGGDVVGIWDPEAGSIRLMPDLPTIADAVVIRPGRKEEITVLTTAIDETNEVFSWNVATGARPVKYASTTESGWESAVTVGDPRMTLLSYWDGSLQMFGPEAGGRPTMIRRATEPVPELQFMGPIPHRQRAGLLRVVPNQKAPAVALHVSEFDEKIKARKSWIEVWTFDKQKTKNPWNSKVVFQDVPGNRIGDRFEFSPDGRWIAVSKGPENCESVLLLDSRNFTVKCEFEVYSEHKPDRSQRVFAFAFSPVGNSLYVGREDGVISCFDCPQP